MPEYFIILMIFLTVGTYLKIHYKIKLYKSTKHLLVTNMLMLFVLVAWDHFAIWRGHWYFGEKFLLGPRIGLMPIEEFGFAIIMFYFALVVYKLVEKYYK